MLDYLFEKFKSELTKRGKAEKAIKNSVIWSMGAGFIPIPLADMVAVTAIQIDMLKQVAAIYEMDFSENQLKSWITALSGSVISRLGADAIKIIPGIGSVIGGISMSVLSGASTYATGQVFVEHFEKGGTLADFDVEKFKDFYQSQFEKGKAYVEDLAKGWDKEKPKAEDAESTTSENPSASSTHTTSTQSSGDIFDKLKELTDMLQKGLLTEEEFKKLKKKLLGD